MTTQKRTFVTIIIAVALLANIVGVGAQEKKLNREVFTVQGDREPMTYAFTGQGDNTFLFVSSEMSIDGKTVKGAPYSAQAVTESIQTLPDGNRIVHRTNASVYRDGEGRTRREQTLNAVGAYSASGDAPQTIFINDPVGQVNYILDAKNKTARKVEIGFSVMRKKSPEAPAAKSEQQQKEMAEMRARGAQDAASKAAAAADREKAGWTAEPGDRSVAELKVRMAEAEAAAVGARAGGMTFEHQIVTKANGKNTKKEDLGKQTIEGIEAVGTRYTTTIAAGEVGNEQPIYVVAEKWYSEELQTVVMMKNSDPRFGENTYRLTNINRSEPAHSLFEVPSDYTLKETVSPNMRYKIESDIKKPGVQN